MGGSHWRGSVVVSYIGKNPIIYFFSALSLKSICCCVYLVRPVTSSSCHSIVCVFFFFFYDRPQTLFLGGGVRGLVLIRRTLGPYRVTDNYSTRNPINIFAAATFFFSDGRKMIIFKRFSVTLNIFFRWVSHRVCVMSTVKKWRHEKKASVIIPKYS